MFVNREKVSKKREEGIVKPLSRKCDAARSNGWTCEIYIRVTGIIEKKKRIKTLNELLDEKYTKYIE